MSEEYKEYIWYGWNGGDCPVHPETVVEWVSLEPFFGTNPAKELTWDHNIDAGDILAFRVVKQYVEPPKPREFWLAKDGVWYETLEYARSQGYLPKNLIHVREVMDGEGKDQ